MNYIFEEMQDKAEKVIDAVGELEDIYCSDKAKR